MPLNLPDKLPAIELLKEENIFVIDNAVLFTLFTDHATNLINLIPLANTFPSEN